MHSILWTTCLWFRRIILQGWQNSSRARSLEEAAQSGEDGDYARLTGAPYGMYRRFLQGASDLPCTPPPWGMLSAVDLNQGTIKWQVPLGSMQYFGGGHDPVPPGSIGFGGPIITATGLVF